MDYREQTSRIKDKLRLAKRADADLRVFGARSHRYVVHEPVDERRLEEFEAAYAISLPQCYRAFLTRIGNGGCSFGGAAAGPFYGIYPLGHGIDDIAESPKRSLRRSPIISPELSVEDWAALMKPLEDDTLSEVEWASEIDRVFGGILPLGSQGCSYIHGLLLAGEYKGKVVNLDLDRQQPHFAYEGNFLDWYERWLDEVISGDLRVDGATWFGYSMGGTEPELVDGFARSTDNEFQHRALVGLLGKARVSRQTLAFAEQTCASSNAGHRATALDLLMKHDYDRARPYLALAFANDPLPAARSMYVRAKVHSEDWVDEIKRLLADPCIDPELFRFIVYLAIECRTDLSAWIKPFASHEEKDIRTMAAYALGKLEDRRPLEKLKRWWRRRSR